MIVLLYTTTIYSSIRLVQLVGGVTKVNMLKVYDKLDLYVSPNLKKDETARRVAQELLDSPIEILSNLNKQELQIIDEFVKGGANTYVVRKTQYKLQKLYLVATYCDEEKQEWHMLMPDELREALSSNYKFYLDLAEKGQKGPTAKQLRMMTAMKRIMGE